MLGVHCDAHVHHQHVSVVAIGGAPCASRAMHLYRQHSLLLYMGICILLPSPSTVPSLLPPSARKVKPLRLASPKGGCRVGGGVYVAGTVLNFHLRPYRDEPSASRPIRADKHRRGQRVLTWVTSREHCAAAGIFLLLCTRTVRPELRRVLQSTLFATAILGYMETAN